MNPPEVSAQPSTDAAPSAPKKSPRRFLSWVPLWLGLSFVVLTGLAVFDAYRVGSELRSGRQQLRTLTHSSAAFATNGSARIARGVGRLAEARDRASESPWLGIVSRLGYAGRPARWLREATAAAASLGEKATAAARRIENRIDAAAGRGGPGRLELLTVVEAELARLATDVERIKVPDPGWAFPPARGAHGSLLDALDGIRRSMDDGRVAARGIRSFLAGPSRYLVLAGNNAEMRSGGMILQAGILRAENGELRPSEFAATGALILPESLPLTEEFNALYGWLEPGREWRNASTSPNFPVVAPLMASMAEAAGIGAVDGVLFLDVVALRELLAVTGPVSVGGVSYDASNVVRLVLHDLYVRFEGEVRERRLEFARLAGETFQALDRPRVKANRLAAGLADATAGRHLLAWSRRAEDQAAWTRLGADGALERDGLLVSVQNHSGNKLDWFVRPEVSATVTDRPGGWKRVHLRVRITNAASYDEPAYIIGNGTYAPVALYRSLVAFHLPGWAANVEIAPGAPAMVGPEGAMRVIGARIDVPLGETVTVDVSFSAPPGNDALTILPSGRAFPVSYRFEGFATDDAKPRRVRI